MATGEGNTARNQAVTRVLTEQHRQHDAGQWLDQHQYGAAGGAHTPIAGDQAGGRKCRAEDAGDDDEDPGVEAVERPDQSVSVADEQDERQ